MSTSRRFARIEVGWIQLEGETALVLSRAPWLGGEPTGERREGPHRFLAPIEPRKILCVGRNYRAHAQELGNDVPVEPMLFLKPSSSLQDPGGSIVLPPRSISERVEHEAELGVVIGSRMKGVTEEEAARGVFGYFVACDVTARDLQKKDGQWWRAKGMDTFCPIGAFVTTGVDPSDLHIECKINGEVRQSGSTRDMIFSIPRVLSHVSQVMTLEPGDIVLTGTPEGVSPLKAGDRVVIAITHLGALEADVVGA